MMRISLARHGSDRWTALELVNFCHQICTRARRLIAHWVGGRDYAGWLTPLLVGGLIMINLAALGFAYWVATRDVVGELTIERRDVRADEPKAPIKAPTARSAPSKRPAELPLEQPRPNASSQPPSPHVNESRALEAAEGNLRATSTIEAPPVLFSHKTARPSPKQESERTPVPTREPAPPSTGRDVQSP
jgi:hypothetical protein